MTELKTKKNRASVSKFIRGVEDEQKRKDSKELVKIFTGVTKEKPAMWGTSIIGFGEYHYKYKSGQEGDWMLTGFSPRKQQISLYMMAGFKNQKPLMKKLGKYRVSSGSCLYIKKLSDINVSVLKKIIRSSVAEVKKRYEVK